MISSYIKTAWRNISRNRLFSAINIFGLMVGLCACLLIGVFLMHEYSYDRFHENGGRIYRMAMEYGMSGTDNVVAMTGTKPGPEVKRRYPAVEEYCRTYRTTRTLKTGDQRFGQQDLLYADPAFFRMFSFPLLQGDRRSALDGVDRIVVSASTATRIFGTQDAMGRTITIGDKPYVVSGVAQDAPSASQIHFDAVTAFTNLGPQVQEEIWFTANWITYVMLKPGQDAHSLERSFNTWLSGPDGRTSTGLTGFDYLRYQMEPLFRVHLHSRLQGFEPNGNPTLLAILAAMAVLILLVAASNYTNLATAQSATRTAEIGIRRVLAAGTAGIAWLVAGGFLRLVLRSSIIVIPLAIYASGQWLNDFAYRTVIPWWTYPMAGLVAMCIAMLGIGLPVWRITRARPAQTIRTQD